MLQEMRTVLSATDLVTSSEAIRDCFLEQALAKTFKASPFVDEATTLISALRAVDSVSDLPRIPLRSVRDCLLAAAGFPQKAQGHLTRTELESALADVLARVKARAGESWREEIVSRFLLTKGDALGGEMRNYTGALGAAKMAAAIGASLDRQGLDPQVKTSSKNTAKIVSLAWQGRLLLFDRTPRFLRKNVDAILLDAETGDPDPKDKSRYIACGELKGGIDPAGADEHWKTATGALNRIREAFPPNPPALFFVGAAIESATAEEMFQELNAGRLNCAANLTVDEQVAELADWLIAL